MIFLRQILILIKKSLANLAVDVRDWLNGVEEGQQVGRRLSQLDRQKMVDEKDTRSKVPFCEANRYIHIKSYYCST